MALSGRMSLAPFDVLQTYVPSNTQDVPAEPGACGTTPDGRMFKLGYILSSGSTLSANKLAQGPANIANLQGVTLSTQAIGDTVVTITCSAQTLTANQLSGALLGVISGTGSPATYRIKSNPAGTSATTYLLQLSDPIYIATSGSPTANITGNGYYGNIVMPTTMSGKIAGIPIVGVTVDTTQGTYFWAQTGGIALAYNSDGSTIGDNLTYDDADAGQLKTGTTTTVIGAALSSPSDGNVFFVDLDLS